MNETVAIGSWHVVVDLRDHIAGTLGGGKRGVNANAKTAEAMGIRWRNFDQRNINWHGAALEQFLNLAEVNRRVIGAAVVDRFPYIRTDKNSVVPKVPSHLRRDEWSHPHGHHVYNFHIAHRPSAPHHSFNYYLSLSPSLLHINPPTPFA